MDLRFKTADRDNVNTVFSAVGVGTITANDCSERWFTHGVCVEDFVEFGEFIYGILYSISIGAELNLDETVATICCVDNCVTFKIVTIAVVANTASCCLGVNAEISEAEVFENKTEGFKVAN